MNEDINLSIKEYLDQPITDVASFITKLKWYEEQIDLLSDENKFLLYLNLGKQYSVEGTDRKLLLAEKYLNDAEEKFSLEIIQKYSSDLYFNLGHLYARLNCSEKSKYYFEKDILSSGKEVVSEIESLYYSFRKINKFTFSDLINNEITLSDPEIFNDPYDTLLFRFLDLRKRKIEAKSRYDISPMIAAYKPIRARCFSAYTIKNNKIISPIKNPLLWAHYADEFRGICILYEFLRPQDGDWEITDTNTLDFWYPIEYKNEARFGDMTKASKQLLLATKHIDWNYENEARLFHYDSLITKEQQHIQIRLEKLRGKIKAIIFGSRCSEKDEQTIRELFKGQDIFFRISGFENLGEEDNVYDLKIDDEEKWRKLTPQ